MRYYVSGKSMSYAVGNLPFLEYFGIFGAKVTLHCETNTNLR